ncbi:MAG: FliM/FliN family flagellar motor switch protein [Chlamydiales bacterium]
MTPEEIEEMLGAMSLNSVPKETQIPLRPPGSYKRVAKIALSPLDGEKASPAVELTDQERAKFDTLSAQIEVLFGKTKLTLGELAALREGDLLPLDELGEDLVDIYVNGSKMARGEVIAVDGHFGVKIASFTKK